MKYDVTEYDGWESEFADWYAIEAENAEDAAERYVERFFAGLDYPNEIDVIVRENASNRHTKATVDVEPIPTFHGRDSIEIDRSASIIETGGEND